MTTHQFRGRGAVAVAIVWALMLAGLFAMTLGMEWLHHDCPLPIQVDSQVAPEPGVQLPSAVDALDYRRLPRGWRGRSRLEVDREVVMRLAGQQLGGLDQS